MKRWLGALVPITYCAAYWGIVSAENFAGIVVDVPARWEQVSKGRYLYLYPPDFGRNELKIALSVKETIAGDLRGWFEKQVQLSVRTSKVLELGPVELVDPTASLPVFRMHAILEDTDPVKRNITFLGLQAQGHAEFVAVMHRSQASVQQYGEDIAIITRSIRTGRIDHERVKRDAIAIEEFQRQAIDQQAEEERAAARRQARQEQIVTQQNAESRQRLKQAVDQMHEQ
jgi:hypothetical protein